MRIKVSEIIYNSVVLSLFSSNLFPLYYLGSFYCGRFLRRRQQRVIASMELENVLITLTIILLLYAWIVNFFYAIVSKKLYFQIFSHVNWRWYRNSHKILKYHKIEEKKAKN